MPERERLYAVVREWVFHPGWGEIPLTEARRAVGVARRLRKQVRDLLPKEVLRRRKV